MHSNSVYFKLLNEIYKYYMYFCEFPIAFDFPLLRKPELENLSKFLKRLEGEPSEEQNSLTARVKSTVQV